jgi:hypothetical protein
VENEYLHVFARTRHKPLLARLTYQLAGVLSLFRSNSAGLCALFHAINNENTSRADSQEPRHEREDSDVSQSRCQTISTSAITTMVIR